MYSMTVKSVEGDKLVVDLHNSEGASVAQSLLQSKVCVSAAAKASTPQKSAPPAAKVTVQSTSPKPAKKSLITLDKLPVLHVPLKSAPVMGVVQVRKSYCWDLGF